MIIFYSTHCPKCGVLKKKLDSANIDYKEIDDVEEMKAKGLTTAPALEVDGELMNFSQAVAWVNNKV